MRNRALASAIALSLLVPGASVLALPSQPDHFCWMRDRWGRVVNLNSMCGGTVGAGAVESAASAPISTRPQKKASGLTVENVKFTEPDEPNANYITMSGYIVNQGSVEEDVNRLGFKVAALDKVRVSGSTKIDRTVPPNGRTFFSINLPKDEIGGNVSMSTLTLQSYSIN